MMDCSSPFIVGLQECFLDDKFLWIMMEYCTAGSVADLLRLSKSNLNEEQIASVVIDVLHGLEFLHTNNRIHRDIKSGNILLTGSGDAKLGDFGVSGQLSKSTTKRHTVIGTPFWMAPEVIQETGHNYKADIWSLGITIIEMAEGHPPHYDVHPLRAIFIIPTRPPPEFADKSKWSPELNNFLQNCLTKNAKDRPSAIQLLNHPWVLKHKGQVSGTLAPLISIAEDSINEFGGREKALNKLYDSHDGSDTSSDSDSDVDMGSMVVKKVRKSESSDEETSFDYGTFCQVDDDASDAGSLVINSDGENDAYVPQYVQLLKSSQDEVEGDELLSKEQYKEMLIDLDAKLYENLDLLKRRLAIDKKLITETLMKRKV